MSRSQINEVLYELDGDIAGGVSHYRAGRHRQWCGVAAAAPAAAAAAAAAVYKAGQIGWVTLW